VVIPASSLLGSVNRRRGGLQGALGDAPRCLGAAGRNRSARGSAAPGSGWEARVGAVGQWRAAAGARRFAQPVGMRRVATGHWARGCRCKGWGTDGRRGASASGPRGSHGAARVVWRADVARQSSGVPRVKTNSACLL
jgi:hypothetical protein